MVDCRNMAVAGMFYPDNPMQLQVMFDQWFSQNGEQSPVINRPDQIPRALILPHAGYIYSGEVAAQGYRLWSDKNRQTLRDNIKTVVIVGPAHRVAFNGIATIGFDAMQTPFGNIEIDAPLRDKLLQGYPQVHTSDYAHSAEHSIEVQLPFIKSLLPDVKVLPLLNGQVTAQTVSDVLKTLWQEEGVFFVISSDLSHFQPYQQAQQIDQDTAQMIQQSQWQNLSGDRACGYKGIQGLLALQPEISLQIEPLQVINSGDAAGDKSSVVGYGAWAIYENGNGR